MMPKRKVIKHIRVTSTTSSSVSHHKDEVFKVK
jgi:hypothetical protein